MISRFIIICIFLISHQSYGQHSELGLFGGLSYYNGELNPSTQILNEINPAIGVFYRKNINMRYALRYGANYGKLSANNEIKTSASGSLTNFSFSSHLFEAYGLLEFNFLPYQINNKDASKSSPYVFIGLAFFRTIASITEDSNMPSGITSTGGTQGPSMPFGAGYKFHFSGNIGISVEWTFRKTLTDEIDGLQERLNDFQISDTKTKDWYSFIGITLNYKFLTESDVCPDVFQ